jgi:parallel beta-helix repeat protein
MVIINLYFRNFILILLLTIFFYFIFCILPVQAENKCTYHVDSSVKITGDGSSLAPFKTIQEAADIAIAGEHVCIRPGIYQEQVIPKYSGKKRQYIIYQKEPKTKGKVVIYGTASMEYGPCQGIFTISHKRYIKVKNLYFYNSHGSGIYAGGSKFITIENNHTYNTWSSGISAWYSDNVKIIDNDIDFACNWQGQSSTGVQENLTLANTSNFVVKGNYVHDSASRYYGGEGIDIKGGSRNGKVYDNVVKRINNEVHFYIDSYGETKNIKVFRNLIDCENVGYGQGLAISSENGETVSNIEIYNNIIANCPSNGVIVSSWSHDGLRDGINIINNTVYHNGGRLSWGGGILIQTQNVNDVVIRNNILSKNGTWSIAVASAIIDKVQVDHNLIHQQLDHYPFVNTYQEIDGANAVYGKPRFKNAEKNNFKLKKSSKAIDHGSRKAAPRRDYRRLLRPQNNKFDIGACEY